MPADAGGRATTLTGRSIVVIDDDPQVLEVIVDALTAFGADVRTANDGASGLTAATQQPCDLVIIDFAMPEMDGADVAAQLRVLRPDLPMLVATGFSESAKLDGLTGDGLAVIRKPFSATALLAAIEALLHGPDKP